MSQRREPLPIKPILRRHRQGAAIEYEGCFDSPAALPATVRRARFRLLLPRGPVRSVCVHLGALGEAGFVRRAWLARSLLADGIGGLLLETPFYGTRRPVDQGSDLLRRCSDQLQLCTAVVREAASLIGWLRAEGHSPSLCGFSMGGMLAAYTAVRLPFPLVTVVSGAGASSADIATRHLLSRLICWSALGGEETARPALASAFDAIALHALPPPVDPTRARLIGFQRDGVVHQDSVRALHEHWPGSRLRWCDTGHVGGALWGLKVMEEELRSALQASYSPPVATYTGQ